MYTDREEEREDIVPKCRKKLSRKRKILVVVIVLIIIISIVTAMNITVIVSWIVPSNIPVVTLLSPADNSTASSNPIQFNWTSSDGDGDPLTHVWYCDISSTFISPFKITVNEGANLTHNHTLDDGDWYWRVEVSDNDGLNSSEVWHLIVAVNASNHFPYLSSPDVSPDNGTTSDTYFYNVTFTDADNNTATYVRVYINGTQYVMNELNLSDTNTTDGKLYTYNTSLPIGTHNYTFTCSDGDAVNSTDLFTGPSVESTSPEQSGVVPVNGSTGISSTPSLYVNCSDFDGDTMNATWWSNSSGAWIQFASNTSIANNTNITQANSNFTGQNITYWWSLNLSDGSTWTNNTYYFTTSTFNTCPESSNPSPANNSAVNPTSFSYWNITITDVDGDTTNGTIVCSCGNNTNWTNESDGIRSLQINQILPYGQTYTVWLNFTDGNCTVNETYHFTTADLFTITNENPSNETEGECPCCISLCIDIAHLDGSLMNLTLYSNLSGSWDYFFVGEENITLSGLSNGTYCINVPFFSIYNHKYYWNASVSDGASTAESPIWHFYTAESPDDCASGASGGGASYTWIVAIIIVFFSIPLGLILRMRKKRRRI